jgi:hypothetical protein
VAVRPPAQNSCVVFVSVFFDLDLYSTYRHNSPATRTNSNRRRHLKEEIRNNHQPATSRTTSMMMARQSQSQSQNVLLPSLAIVLFEYNRRNSFRYVITSMSLAIRKVNTSRIQRGVFSKDRSSIALNGDGERGIRIADRLRSLHIHNGRNVTASLLTK